MFSASVGPVVMFDQRLWGPSEQGGRWAMRLARNLSRNVKAAAPVNKRPQKTAMPALYGGPPGHLKRSIEFSHTRLYRGATISVSVDAPYAMYVLKGTDRIYAKNPKGMLLPINGFWRLRHHTVSGQAANNFFERGVNATIPLHPSLSGYNQSGTPYSTDYLPAGLR